MRLPAASSKRRADMTSTRQSTLGGAPPSDNVRLKEISTKPEIEDENRPKKYSRIRTLIISWKDHDCDPANMEKQLTDVYNHFRFYLCVHECERWAIPAKGGESPDDSQNHVQRRLVEFKQKYNGDENELLIVYYSGHGGWWNSTFYWCGRSTAAQFIDWTRLQWDCMFHGSNDAAVILDCCYSGQVFEGISSVCKPAIPSSLRRKLSNLLRAALGRQRKLQPQTADHDEDVACKSVLAACPGNATTPQSGINSFTARWLLAGRFKKPFTLEQWFEKTRRLSREQARVLPVYRSFGNGRRKIWLGPALLGGDDM